MAEEARRWTLWRTTDMRWMSGDNDDVGGPFRVREDRAYEADVEKAARAIAFDDDRRGYEHADDAWEDLWEDRQQQVEHNQDPGEPTREDYRLNARAALIAVFSDPGLPGDRKPASGNNQ
jgi:hypothetical protein